MIEEKKVDMLSKMLISSSLRAVISDIRYSNGDYKSKIYQYAIKFGTLNNPETKKVMKNRPCTFMIYYMFMRTQFPYKQFLEFELYFGNKVILPALNISKIDPEFAKTVLISDLQRQLLNLEHNNLVVMS